MIRESLFAALTFAVLASSASAQGDEHLLIVPGERIGNARIGMSMTELLRQYGEPLGTNIYTTEWTSYSYGFLFVDIRGDRIIRLGTSDRRLQTEGGVRVGSSDISVRAVLGAPACVSHRSHGNQQITDLYYRGILQIEEQNGTVTGIGVFRDPNWVASDCRSQMRRMR